MPSKKVDANKPLKHNVWVIGDLHGCANSLDALLAHPTIKDDKNCRFWFVGDLINRGPHSLRTLKRIISLGDRAVALLGNHDIHSLAVYAGVRQLQNKDTISEILESKDAKFYFDWLRKRPLAHAGGGHLIVHAGVLQNWTAEDTLAHAAEVSDKLRSDKWKTNISKMFGNYPNKWADDLKMAERRMVIINALTRMRMCHRSDGSMEFSNKGAPTPIDASQLVPWFRLPNRAASDTTILFGHWSALGLTVSRNIVSLDSGCVWGGHLTAFRLNDRKIVQVPYQG